MGQKVSPHGFRVGIIKDWSSKWYADKNDFSDILIQDTEIRKELKHKLYDAGISRIVIERPNETKIRIDILVEKPGLVIGTKGAGTKAIKELLEKKTSKKIDLNIVEAKVPELDAQLLAERIAKDLERRTAFRRAMKTAMGSAVKAGAKGVKIFVSGRLNGAEIARAEKYNEGSVPLHTLRADIDYGFTEAETTYGKLGVKVWINKGEILESGLKRQIPEKRRDDDDQKRRRTSGGGEGRRSGRAGGAGGRSAAGGKGRRVSSRRDSRADLTRQQNPRMRINDDKGKKPAAAKPEPETKPEAAVGGSDSAPHIAPPDAPKKPAPETKPEAAKPDTSPDAGSAAPEHGNKENE